MKHLVLLITLIFIITEGEAQQYNLDINQSEIKWTGKAAFLEYALSGTLLPDQGTILIVEDSMMEAMIVIDMLTLDAENQDLKKHLQSKDFFEVKKYPLASFELERWTLLNKLNAVAYGKLTIKDISLFIETPIQFQHRGDEIFLQGKLAIDRTEYGIVYNSPSFFKKLKDQAIADVFDLEFYLVFDRKGN